MLAVVGLVLALGMIAGAGLWMMAAMSVAGVLVLSSVVSRKWADSISVERQEVPSDGRDLEVVIGSRVPVTVVVENKGSLPIAWALIEDLLPRAAARQVTSDPESTLTKYHASNTPLLVDGPRLAALALMPGAKRPIRYSVECQRRGYFQIGPTVVETGDPVGMFRRYRLGAAPMFITVLPKIRLLSTYEIGSRRPIGEIRIRESAINDPTRLRGIRQWQVGDPMRSVHWAATARTGTLHSKVYEPSSILGATVILDMHVDTNPDAGEPTRTDLAVTAAASIAAALHDAGEPFGFATNGRDAADRVRQEGFLGDHRVRDMATKAARMKTSSDRLRPVIMDVDRGPLHLKEILRSLARTERTDGLSLAEFLVECESRLSNQTTLLVILQQAPPESIAALVSLARRGWAVAVVINTLDINTYSSTAAPLIAENIHVSHLPDEEAILDVCRAQMVR